MSGALGRFRAICNTIGVLFRGSSNPNNIVNLCNTIVDMADKRFMIYGVAGIPRNQGDQKVLPPNTTSSLEESAFESLNKLCEAGVPSEVKLIDNMENEINYFFSYGCGDDAFFASNRTLAVADGVGGWKDFGGNPELYSRSLLSKVFKKLIDVPYDRVGTMLPEIINQAVCENLSIIGSCTLTIASFNGPDDDMLMILNIGDSGCMILRDNEIVFRTKDSIISSYYPSQLGTSSKKTANDASVDLFLISPGDIVVLATDGLFDNIKDEQVIECVKPYSNLVGMISASLRQNRFGRMSSLTAQSGYRQANLLASRLSQIAYGNSKRYEFQGHRYYQGKPDDISVVVGFVI